MVFKILDVRIKAVLDCVLLGTLPTMRAHKICGCYSVTCLHQTLVFA